MCFAADKAGDALKAWLFVIVATSSVRALILIIILRYAIDK